MTTLRWLERNASGEKVLQICVHPLVNSGSDMWIDVPTVQEPPAPRKAREFDLAIGSNGQIKCMQSGYLSIYENKADHWEFIKVREILDRDGVADDQ